MPVSTNLSLSLVNLREALSQPTNLKQNTRRHPKGISNVPAGIKSIHSGGRRNSCPALYSTSDDAPVDASQGSDKAAAGPSLININDFERGYRRDSMAALLECAGDQREKLTQLLQNTPSLLVKSHVEHIANAHFLARLLEPSGKQSANLDRVMHDLTDLMLKDKLGNNSVFGGNRPEQKAACQRRLELEKELALLVNTLQGEDGAKPGERFINKKIKPFVVDYIVQETGRDHGAVKTNHIEQLVEKNAYQCFQNIRSGIQTYQAPSLEKIFRDMDMILILPNLLANSVSQEDAPSRLNTRPTKIAESMTEATGQDDRTDGADKTGDKQNNRTTPAPAPGVNFKIKYAPKIKIDASVKINWPLGTGSEKISVDKAQPDGLRDGLQDIIEQIKQARNTKTHSGTVSHPRSANTPLPTRPDRKNVSADLNAAFTSSLITRLPQGLDNYIQPELPVLGQDSHNRPAEFAATALEPVEPLTHQGGKQIMFTATTTENPQKGAAHVTTTNQATVQSAEPNSVYSAARRVAEALVDLLRPIPARASPIIANYAPNNGRAVDGPIASVYTATKTVQGQKGTTRDAHTGHVVPPSDKSHPHQLTEEMLRAAKEMLKATPPRSAEPTRINPVAHYLVKARAGLSSKGYRPPLRQAQIGAGSDFAPNVPASESNIIQKKQIDDE